MQDTCKSNPASCKAFPTTAWMIYIEMKQLTCLGCFNIKLTLRIAKLGVGYVWSILTNMDAGTYMLTMLSRKTLFNHEHDFIHMCRNVSADDTGDFLWCFASMMLARYRSINFLSPKPRHGH